MNLDAHPSGDAASEALDTGLSRVISRRMLLVFIVGDIIGGGIYALVGTVAGEVGGAVWAPFMVALVLALLTAGAYAELITKYPRAGGAALFAQRAFRSSFIAFMVGYAVIASGISSASTLARAFSGDYFAQFVDVPVLAVALPFLLVAAAVNFYGISLSVRVNLVFTVVEVLGLLLIVGTGAAMLFSGDAEPSRALQVDGDGTASKFLVVLGGAALAFYALIGFEDSANVAEEARDPVRDYPPALFQGIGLAGVVYLLVTVTASMAVPTEQLATSTGPLLEVVREGWSGFPLKVFAAIGLLALANGALINMIMASRLLYGLGTQGVLPGAFALVHESRRTPWFSIVVTTALAMVLVATGDIGDLASVTALLLVLVFIVANVAVLMLRRERVAHEHFRVPTIVPVCGVLVCAVLLTQQQVETFVRAAAILVPGIALWLLYRVTGGERR